MIRYTLKCAEGHSFESWFQSSDAFDALASAGHLNCAQCGSSDVSKSLMAPKVMTSDSDAENLTPVLHNPQSDVEKAMAELRKKVEESSDYVGERFTDEARAMHLGEMPERAIYGEARLDQAKDLIDDGVPLMPLPFRPRQKSN